MAQHNTSPSQWADDLSDGALVARVVAGERSAFAPLVSRYARQVYNITYRISGNAADAEDLTQETFLRAFRTLHTLREPQAFAGWLYQIATNTAIDALRRHGKLSQAELTDAVANTYPDDARSPQDVAMAGEDQRAVWAALERLAPAQRTALTLREMQGLSYAAIAAAMGMNAQAVDVLLFRARRRFREHFEKITATRPTGTQLMPCSEAQRALATVLDGEGNAEQRSAVLAHVRTCSSCQAEIAAQRAAARRRAMLPLLPLPPGIAPPAVPPGPHPTAPPPVSGPTPAPAGGGAVGSGATATAFHVHAATLGSKLALVGGTKAALLVAAGITAAGITIGVTSLHALQPAPPAAVHRAMPQQPRPLPQHQRGSHPIIRNSRAHAGRPSAGSPRINLPAAPRRTTRPAGHAHAVSRPHRGTVRQGTTPRIIPLHRPGHVSRPPARTQAAVPSRHARQQHRAPLRLLARPGHAHVQPTRPRLHPIHPARAQEPITRPRPITVHVRVPIVVRSQHRPGERPARRTRYYGGHCLGTIRYYKACATKNARAPGA